MSEAERKRKTEIMFIVSFLSSASDSGPDLTQRGRYRNKKKSNQIVFSSFTHHTTPHTSKTIKTKPEEALAVLYITLHATQFREKTMRDEKSKKKLFHFAIGGACTANNVCIYHNNHNKIRKCVVRRLAHFTMVSVFGVCLRSILCFMIPLGPFHHRHFCNAPK